MPNRTRDEYTTNDANKTFDEYLDETATSHQPREAAAAAAAAKAAAAAAAPSAIPSGLSGQSKPIHDDATSSNLQETNGEKRKEHEEPATPNSRKIDYGSTN